MRPSFGLAATLAVGIALGFAAGYYSGRPEDSAESIRAPVTDAREASDANGPRSAGARASSSKSPAASPTLDELVASAAVPAAGDERITGFVRDLDGRAVAGVHVTATPGGEPPAGNKREGESPLAFEVRRVVERHRWAEVGRREATTGEDGAFAVTGLVEGDYGLEASLDGWKLTLVGEFSGKPGARCEFQAARLCGVVVHVLRPDGKSPEKARVSFDAGDDSESVDWTPDAARLSVPVGVYAVSATSGEDSEYASENVLVRVAESGETGPVEIRLRARPGVRGRILFAPQSRGHSVRVALVRVDETHPAEPARLLAEGPASWVDGASEDARFSFSNVDPGTYLLGATFRDGSIGPTATIDVGEAALERDLAVGDVDVHEDVLVHVLAPDGTPLDDADVRCGFVADGVDENGPKARRLGGGTFRAVHHAPGAPTGNWCGTGRWRPDPGEPVRQFGRFVEARSSAFGTARASYDPRRDREVTVRFAPPARIAVSLPGFDRCPYATSVRLTVHRLDESDESTECVEYEVAPDARGRRQFGPMSPGRFELEVRAQSRNGSRTLATRRIAAHEGDNALAIELPLLCKVTVTCPDGAAGHVVLRSNDGRHEIEASEATGDSALFVLVPAGRWRVAADEGPQSGEMAVDLTGDATIRWLPRPIDALRVVVDEDDSVARSGGLRDGDLVVAIDGQEFANSLQIDALLAAAKSHDRARLTVVRDGRRSDVDCDVKGLGPAVEFAKTAR